MKPSFDLLYRRSSFCDAGSCVEVAPLPDGQIALRDSKDVSVPEHRYTSEEWAAFIRGVKAGEFDFAPPAGSPHS